MRAIAVALAVSCTLLGPRRPPRLGLERGPSTIVIASAVFFVSLAWRRER